MRIVSLIASATELQNRLHHMTPPVFDAHGNRQGGRSEYVAVLRPQLAGLPPLNHVQSTATLEVWARESGGAGPTWRPIKRLILNHGRTSRPNF